MSYNRRDVMPNQSMKNQKKLKKSVFMLIFLVLSSFLSVFGQKSIQNEDFAIPQVNLQLIEEYLESIESDEGFDYLELIDFLTSLYRDPLDINSLTSEDLYNLFLLSDIQIVNFMTYRDAYGPFISIYELQAIPSFDLRSIQRILPFIALSDKTASTSNVGRRLQNAQHELLMRTSRTAETLDGSIKENGFVGDPYRHFLRYRMTEGRNFKFGVLAEKDVGEEFFKGSNKSGFDFYTYHISLSDVSKKLKYIILGDYAVSLGQGLIVQNQFGTGLTSFTTNVKRNNRTFKNYTSRNETNFFKGVGTTISLSPTWTTHLFASRNRISGTLRDLDDDGTLESFSSIDESGNHRTITEIEKKNKIKRSSLGGSLEHSLGNGNISLNLLLDHFDKTLDPLDRPDNIFNTASNSFFNASIDYSFNLRNANIFGESAYSDNGGLAHIAGLLLGLDPKLDLALIYRNYSPNYTTINPNAFGQSLNANNEKGLYIGLEIRPIRNITINAYADYWKNPWLRFRVDNPGSGEEYLIKLTYTKRRRFSSYVLFRTESKPRNSQLDLPVDFAVAQKTSRLRFQVNNNISQTLELRNRLEFSFFKNDIDNHRGVLINQDVIFRPRDFPLSFSSRVMWFNVADFDARIYTYENDVYNDFSIPFFSGNGLRYYLNLRFRHRRNSFELRVAQTRYFDRETISSGLTEIQNNTQTVIKAQMRFRF